jgi:hypothetical protein
MKMNSALIAIGRGSIAGLNFTGNHFHRLILRRKPVGTQPHSTNQSLLRSCFAFSSTQWRSRSASVKQAWQDYADTLTFQSPVSKYRLPGRTVFISNMTLAKYYYIRGALNNNPLAAAPTFPGFITINLLRISTPPTAGVGFKVQGSNFNGQNIVVVVQISPPQDPSRNTYSGQYKSDVLYSTEVANGNQFSIDVTGLTAGRKYFARIKSCATVDQIRISGNYFMAIVAA